MALGTFFSVALGGLAEAVAGKSLDLGIEGAMQAQKTLQLVEQQPLSVVQATVDAACQDLLDRYKYGEDAQKPGVIQDLVRQLEHPPFAQEVAQHLLFGGQIDFHRLERVYLQVDDATTERWAALQPYLKDFFAQIKQRLLGDLKVGPLLVATRSLAVHIETARRMELLTAAAEQMQGLQGRTASATERTAEASEQMAADIARLLQRFDQVIVAFGRADDVSVVAKVSALSDAHLEYLRSWFAKPWTNVKLADISRRQDQARLLDVYVPLQVDCNVVVQVKEHVISDWWIGPDNDERTQRIRSWRDLGVDEAAMQQIVDGIQRKITERRAAGQATRDGRHTWSMEAHHAASVQPRFVLLGDPGGGKSSFLRHLTLCQAGELRRRHQDGDVPENAGLAALKDWLLTKPLTPIYIELRDLVRLSFPPLPVAREQDAAPPTLEDLWQYIRQHLLGPGQAEFEQVLRRLCREGEAILLLDGLDEVPMATDSRRRQQIKSLVEALHGAYPRLRMVISGRPHAYRRGEWELEGFGRAQLEPLDGQRLNELAQALFRVVSPQNAEAEAETFVDAILRDPHIDRSLHANPLFFTMLAAIWFRPERPGQLPATKADLYRQAVDLLLDRWTRKRLPDTSVSEKLGMPPKALRPMLETLACTVHQQSTVEQDSTIFRVDLLLGMLYQCEFNVGIKDVPDYLTQHAGILISPAPGELAFVHRSFQEHLAASELICVEVKDRLPLVASDRRFPQGLLDRIHVAR
jgi:adenylate kinase family enzyme